MSVAIPLWRRGKGGNIRTSLTFDAAFAKLHWHVVGIVTKKLQQQQRSSPMGRKIGGPQRETPKMTQLLDR